MRSAGVTSAHLMRVDGSVGIVVALSGHLYSVMAFEIKDGKISTIRIIGETSRLNALKLTLLEDQPALKLIRK